MELQKILENTIINNSNHQDYERVVNLHKEYVAFTTNEPNEDGEYPLNEYLRQFVRREDDDLFEQRKNLTKHYTPSIISSIRKMYNKVVRSNRVIKLIDHSSSDTIKQIDKTLNNFYGEAENNGVDQFLNERFLPLTFTDPNAWIWITFKPFDGKKEKPQTYPLEYSCESVINFKTENDVTKWVIVKLEYNYVDKFDKNKKADRFIIFGENESIEYKLIPKDIKETFVDGKTEKWTHPENKNEFAIYTYKHNSNRVPLMRVGYTKDIETKSRTFVSPIHYDAMPLLRQFIKVSSELQLAITLHTFPKQVSYVSKCEAKGCNNGTLTDNITQCIACEGTGKQHHSTTADIIELPMPSEKRLNEMVDASKVSSYIEFPGGVMDFLDRYADKLEEKIMIRVFNSESIIQKQYAKTATEKDQDMDAIYDTLHPFGDKYSELWMFFVKMTVLYIGFEGVTIWHKFPTDLKLKSLGQLLNELKTANDSGAPSYIRESINNDIADIIYADDQQERSKLSIKNKHYPFSGKNDFEIQNIILNNLTTKYNQVLYANFDNIFDDMEIENKNFYGLAYDKQKALIKAKVESIMNDISGATVPVLDLKTA